MILPLRLKMIKLPKLNQAKPEGMDLKPGIRACSLDSDADRIVYYYADKGKIL